MSDYRRFVSYMYLYENNMKSMNAGFVKVESRNGKCRIGLSLKNVYSGMGRLQVYMFMRFGQELRGIFIGQVQAKNHGCDWNFRTETNNIAGSGYMLEQMSGMLIKGDGNKFYGTRWDQGDLDVQRFVTEWEEETTVEEAEMEVQQQIKTEMEVDEEAVLIQDTQEILEAEEIAFMKEKEIEKPQMLISATSEHDKRDRDFAKILEQCPGMYPFEDDAIEACVRFEPQDVGMMPLDCWSYGSNSFLLHGYYSYRHLIFARMKADEQQRASYILGVPGTHHSREAFMANMFGFKEFKPIREGDDSSSDFGYWYTKLG